MIQPIETDNNNVLAFKVSGKITESEVRQTIALIEKAIHTKDGFNLYVQVAKLDGIELAAMKQRFSFIFTNFKPLLKKVKKLSLVSDNNWLGKFAEGLYYFIPSIEHKSFSTEEIAQAREYVGLGE